MEDDIQQLYIKQLKAQLLENTHEAIQRLIARYPYEFDLHALIPPPANPSDNDKNNSFLELYQTTLEEYRDNDIEFDIHWHWTLPWRQNTSYKILADSYGQEKVIAAAIPRSRRAISQIYEDGLDPFMRWFPWRWFSDITLIGIGGFSAVYFAVLNTPYEVHDSVEDRIVALKVVDDKILNEIAVQSKAFNPVLFQGITVCESTGDMMMIMNLAEGGNLEDHIKRDPLADSEMDSIVNIALRLAISLSSLHDDIGFCHRNIHPRNIIHADSEYFLVDYRYSTPSEEATAITRASKAHYGRVPYIAPEVRRGLYTTRSDVYSMGIVLWQLVSKVLFPASEILLDNPNIYRIEPVPGVPKWFEALYTACLEPTPQHRPNATEILATLTYYSKMAVDEDTDERKMTNYVAERRLACQKHETTQYQKSGTKTGPVTGLYVLSKVPSFEDHIKLNFKRSRYRTPNPK
ncbi:kinase-like domain-containing protein [Umbelopsis sp. PMI_123]|nr:kinase-like domain-containing protein [Umbelopsis sp. PMI_123]